MQPTSFFFLPQILHLKSDHGADCTTTLRALMASSLVLDHCLNPPPPNLQQTHCCRTCRARCPPCMQAGHCHQGKLRSVTPGVLFPALCGLQQPPQALKQGGLPGSTVSTTATSCKHSLQASLSQGSSCPLEADPKHFRQGAAELPAAGSQATGWRGRKALLE